MRIFTLTLAIFLLWFGSAVANDNHGHIGEYKIVGWEWSYGTINIGGDIIIRSVTIEESTTCVSGSITIDLYEGTGESRTFIGAADGRIRGYAFSVTVNDIERPKLLSIEYSIETEEVVVADPGVQCKIEDVRWWHSNVFFGIPLNDRLRIEGSTTCASGFVTLRLYEGTGELRTFIGTVDGRIRGYAFSVTKTFDIEKTRQSLSIEYSIETDVNDPPVITTVLLADATENEAYDDRVKAIDRDVGDTITFAKVLGPDWMTVSENGAVGGTPGVFDVGTEFAVSISVEDAVGAADTLNTSIAVIAKDVVVVMECKIKDLWWYSDTINFRRFVTI